MDLLKRNSGTKDAGKVRECWEKSVRAMRDEQLNFCLNKEFVLGDQWMYRETHSNTIRPYRRDDNRTRTTVNKLWPASRHLMAKLLSRELVFEVQPSEVDDGTVRGAMTAEAVLDDLMREHNWEMHRKTVAWSTWLGGTAGLCLEWDASAGPTIGQNALGKPFGTGEIVETALTVLEMGWEPGTRNAETATWWVRAQALPPCEVMDRYDMKKEPAADANAALGYVGRSMDSSTSTLDLTLVLTYYERPNKKTPEGCVMTVVGNTVVDGPHPWPFPWKDRLNLVVFRETQVDSRATGDTILSAAVPIQTAFNAAWSNLIEHLKLGGNARLLIPDTALDGVDELTDLPAEIINYNSQGGKPEWLTPAYMPPWVIEQPAMLAAQIDDIVGLHEVSRGNAPTNVESGVGLSVLVEQDSTPLGALTKEMAHGFGRFACMVLELYAANVKETRKAKLRGESGQAPEVIDWTGESLCGQTVAVVPIDAVMPKNRAASFAMAREMHDRKLITDFETFAKVADIPDQQYLLDALDIDTAKAARENRAMAIGKICVPADFDDHQKHIKRHNDFRKTLRYETMKDDERELVDMHLQGHETFAAEEMGKQVAKMNVAPAFAAAANQTGAPQLDPMTGAPPMPGAPGAPPTGPTGPPAQPTPADQQNSISEVPL